MPGHSWQLWGNLPSRSPGIPLSRVPEPRCPAAGFLRGRGREQGGAAPHGSNDFCPQQGQGEQPSAAAVPPVSEKERLEGDERIDFLCQAADGQPRLSGL